MACAMLLSAVIFGWVTIKTRPMATDLARRSRPEPYEDLVRRACADLDEEYRELLKH